MNDLPSEASGKDDHFRQVTEKVDLVRAVANRLVQARSGRTTDVWLRVAEDAITAIEQAGYAVVPREPTKEMVKAACKSMSPGRRPTPDYVTVNEKHRIRYRAMLAAAERDDG